MPKFRIAQDDELVETVQQHRDAEKRLGAEIYPAARKQSFTEEGRDDDERKSLFPNCIATNRVTLVCRELDDQLSKRVSLCSANANGLLDW